MEPLTQDPFAEGLSYEDALPLQWRPMDGPLSGEDFLRLNRDNEAVLKVVMVLGESRPESADDPNLSSELGHLDFKLNVLLDLVGRLVIREQRLPAPAGLRLSARGLEWVAESPPALGARLLVSLYLHPPYPRPVELPARVLSVEPAASGARVRVRFEELSEVVAEGLERLIFRNHRRLIAQSRTPRNGD
jgi:hypothetical protein